jgi:hypothetical protein
MNPLDRSFKFSDKAIQTLKSDINASKPNISIADQTAAALQAEWDLQGGSNKFPFTLLVQLIKAIVEELVPVPVVQSAPTPVVPPARTLTSPIITSKS